MFGLSVRVDSSVLLSVRVDNSVRIDCQGRK